MLPRSLFATLALAVLAVPAGAEPPKVVTDIAPVQGLVARVMAGVGEPDVLVPPGASPHGYSLRPSDARALSNADAVFWIGDALEPWLEDTIAQLATDAPTIALLDVPGTVRLEFRDSVVFAADHDAHADHDHADGHETGGHEGHDHGEHDDHAHDDHANDDHAHDDHAHGDHAQEDHQDHDAAHHDHVAHDHVHEGVDPHAWLAPENGKTWLAKIAEELSRIDPANAEIYQSNALAGQAEIDQVTLDLQTRLSHTHGQFVVFHDAYQYFETSFDLESLGAISLGDASDPSVARIGEIREAVVSAGVSCVFAEPQFNPGLVRTVTEGTEIASLVIDPLGLEVEQGPQFYPQLLARTGARFVDCLGE